MTTIAMNMMTMKTKTMKTKTMGSHVTSFGSQRHVPAASPITT